MPAVSVVIPTRNRPALVLRAVESALAQTCADLEVVVIIDGPDAATRNVLEALQEPRLLVVELEQSVGGSEARNQGVVHAKGKWIALLDDDDEWMPTKIARQLEIAEAAQNPYMLVFTRMVTRYPTEEFIWPRRLPEPGEKICDYLFIRKGFSFGEGFLQTSSFFTSRQMLSEVPFRKGQLRFQDTDWLLRASSHPKAEIHVIADPLVIYYMNDSAAVSRKPDWEYLYNWGRENLLPLSKRAYSYFLATQCMPRAGKQDAPFRVKAKLLWECIGKGSATLNCIFLGLVYWFTTEKFRHALRDSVNAAGKAKQRLVEP